MITKRFFHIAAALSASLLCGCALTTDRISIHYKSPATAAPLPGASAIMVSVQVNDQRQDKSKVSSKKNGFGMEMAPILALEEPAVTIRRAMEQELTSRGFRLGPDAFVSIACDLTRFYNDHKMGFFAGDAVAELNMLVVVRSKDGHEIFSRVLVAQGMEPNTQLSNGNNAMLALEQALTNGMKLLFEDQNFLGALMSAQASNTAP